MSDNDIIADISDYYELDQKYTLDNQIQDINRCNYSKRFLTGGRCVAAEYPAVDDTVINKSDSLYSKDNRREILITIKNSRSYPDETMDPVPDIDQNSNYLHDQDDFITSLLDCSDSSEDLNYQNLNYQDLNYQDLNYQDLNYQDLNYQDLNYQDLNYQNLNYQNSDNDFRNNFSDLMVGIHPMSMIRLLDRLIRIKNLNVINTINTSMIKNIVKNNKIPIIKHRTVRYMDDITEIGGNIISSQKMCNCGEHSKIAMSNLNTIIRKCNDHQADDQLYHRNYIDPLLFVSRAPYFVDICIRSNIPLRVYVHLDSEYLLIGLGKNIKIDIMDQALMSSMYIEADNSKIDAEWIFSEIYSKDLKPYISFDYHTLIDHKTVEWDLGNSDGDITRYSVLASVEQLDKVIRIINVKSYNDISDNAISDNAISLVYGVNNVTCEKYRKIVIFKIAVSSEEIDQTLKSIDLPQVPIIDQLHVSHIAPVTLYKTTE
jgi:hypothetical protein